MLLCCYLLYEDYQRVGKFQLVDQNAIEDNEELYINVISIMVLGLGFFSILTQFSLNKLYSNNYIKIFMKTINSIYGIFLVSVSAIFFLLLLGNLGNNSINGIKDIVFLSLMFLILISFGYLGFIIIWQVVKKENSRKNINSENILDYEIK